MNIKQIVSLITAVGTWLSIHFGLSKYIPNLADPSTQDMLTLVVTLIVNHCMHGTPNPPDAGMTGSLSKNPALFLLAMFILPALLVTGCSSTPVGKAYQSETALDTAITAALDAWGAYVAANHPSAAVETQVRDAFDKARAAELLANSATELAQQSSNTNVLSSLAANTAI
jgi:hypothetical protein